MKPGGSTAQYALASCVRVPEKNQLGIIIYKSFKLIWADFFTSQKSTPKRFTCVYNIRSPFFLIWNNTFPGINLSLVPGSVQHHIYHFYYPAGTVHHYFDQREVIWTWLVLHNSLMWMTSLPYYFLIQFISHFVLKLSCLLILRSIYLLFRSPLWFFLIFSQSFFRRRPSHVFDFLLCSK